MIEDDQIRRDRLAAKACATAECRAKRQYTMRRDSYLQNYAGATDEDMVLLRETGILDATDVNLLGARAVKEGLDLFGGRGVAKKITRTVRATEAVVDAANTLRKLFRY